MIGCSDTSESLIAGLVIFSDRWYDSDPISDSLFLSNPGSSLQSRISDTNTGITTSISRSVRLLWPSFLTKSVVGDSATDLSMNRMSPYFSTLEDSSWTNTTLISRLLDTIRQNDYYLVGDDFDSCKRLLMACVFGA